MQKEDQVDYDVLRERLSTVGGAQEVVDETFTSIRGLLARPNFSSGRGLDNFEPTPIDLERELDRLRFALFNLPEEVATVSVGFKFPRVPGRPITNREFELENLQSLIAFIGVDTDTDVIQSEIVVLPPFMPEELTRMGYGSASRALAYEVRETLALSTSSQIHVLEVKPHGAPGGEAGIRAMNAMNYRVPLAQVEYVRLDAQPQPLTPWLERLRGEIFVREVEEE